MLGKERSAKIKYVCSDMWKSYLQVIAKKAGQALQVLGIIVGYMIFTSFPVKRS